MKKYKFNFHGRQTGALGITYQISEEYNASCLEEACSMLYIDYEHFRGLHAYEGTKQIDTDVLKKAIYADFKTDYKCKGAARK